ncbi:leucyl aminopeptidase [Nakamurella deserti]|uniref:leucyl aminopeptidase n=1 Tax=Nakamurella deserti TaxID=2164074 RepID=UPI000DBE0F3C|nr:leucyl aminopeptidase [Nakamurella deserti]
MTELSLSTANPVDAAVDALVVGLHPDGDGVAVADERLADSAAAFAGVGATGKAGEVVRIPAPAGTGATSLVGVGLGPVDAVTPEKVRRGAGAATRALAGVATLGSLLGAVDLAAAAEGHLLGAYQFDRYKTPAKATAGTVTLFVTDAGDAAEAIVRRSMIGAEAVGLARDLINTAPNDLPPAVFADRASAAAKEAGLSVEVLDEKALARDGYGGILGVGSGSTRPPRLVRLAWTPANPVKTVALVGKGITFDSGGISIKPAQNMDHMTSDMSGAACVVATVIAAAALRLPVAVIAYAPLAENLPSGSSYRPGDVLTHFGGKTVHVLNTDAEGRLVLADAIVRATRDEPDYLIETSTLTGAQLVALGSRTMGVMGSDAFRDRVAELARATGEGGWAMPLPEELREGLDSQVADIANVAGDRFGGMLVAGHYLKEFIPEGLPWAHLDIAGPAFNTGKPHGYTAAGGTGVPVRTLLAVLEDIAAEG